jgi:hypothetical protein
MATKYVIQLDVNAQGAITNADQVAEKLKAADKAAGAAAGGMLALRKELKAVESELSGLDPNSAAFAELSQKAGLIKDQMKDIKEAVGNQAGPAVEVFGNNLGKLKGDLGNLDFEGATSAIRGMGNAVKGFSFKDLIGGIKNFGSALASVGKALLTNPIFLIAAAVAAAALAINAAFESIQAEQQKTIDLAYENANAEKEKLAALSEGENTLRLQGKSEKEILKLKIDQANAAVEAQITAIETQKAVLKDQIETAKRNKEIASGIIQFITLPIQVILATVDKIAGFLGKELNLRDKLNDFLSSKVFDPDQIAKDGEASVKENEKTLAQLKNQRDGFILSQRDAEKKARDERMAAQKAANEAMLAEEKRVYEERKKLLDEFKMVETIGIEATKKVEADKIVIKQGALAQQDALRQAELEREQAAIDRDAALTQMRVDNVNNGLSTISNLTTLFAGKSERSQKRAFEIQKRVQIAMALADTYKGATAAYASQIIPGDPTSVVRGGLAAAAAVAAGLVNVAQIRKQQFTGGSGSGGGGGGSAAASLGGGGSAPNFTVTNDREVGERPDQPAIKTYVIASDVTSNQEATEKIESRTRIG